MIENLLIIGAGRVGTTLAGVLSELGFNIPFLVSNAFPEDFQLKLANTESRSDIDSKLIENTDIILITVPDDQVQNIVTKLNSVNADWKNKLILHSSGCLSSIELHSLKRNGAQIGSIHPLQTFDSYFLDRKIFNGIVLAVEGDIHAIHFAENIAKHLNMNVLKLKPEDKISYHIAAVTSSNFLIALLDYTSRIYNELALDDSKIKELMLPIVNQTVNNFFKNEANQIITGPLKRSDLGTIEKHIQHLKKNQNDLLPVYKEISKYISQFIIKPNEPEKDKLSKILNND